MFKNSLFSKIVFIFTLPVLGILYFSSITVLDKTELLNDFKKNELKVEYLKESQNIISSLEKEKILSLNFFKDPQKLDSLLEQQSSTTQKIEKINKLIDNLPWKDNWKEQLTNLKISFTSLDEFRQKILKDELDENSIKKHYNELIKDIIEPLFLLKFNTNTINFQQELLKLEDIVVGNNSVEKLLNSFNFTLYSLTKELKELEDKVNFDKNLSYLFFFFCIFTLLPLFFILKKIISEEQNSFLKIQKHKNIYELLNQANKFLAKTFKKDDLYLDISDLLSDGKNLSFSFIYDFENRTIVAKDGVYKNIVVNHVNKFSDFSQENMISKTIKRESNVIINDFKEKNVSVFYSRASEFNINSMATFPIKKFNKVVAVLILYSNELNFFDSEAEILFDKLVLDITNCLEKIDYEERRMKQDSELKLSSYAFDTSAPMLITNDKNMIIKVNQAFCKIMTYSKDELLGENPRIFKTAHQDKALVDRLWSDLKINGAWTGDLYNRKADGTIIALRATISVIRDENDNITNYLAQYMDISEQKDKEKILEYQATHDNLTGLPNRLLLTDRIERAITKTVRHNIFGGLIFIDLDNFKEVNDTLGHDIGDVLLITVAKKLKECVREEDTVSRIGGDEFIVLLDNLGNNSDDARRNINFLAEKIKDALNSITHLQGYKNVSTPSIGITLFHDSSVSVQDIIKQADTAMYSAKKQGKNTIEFF
ncbi:diguanylate cyclase [Aliarcobacter trophiarum LMG 25534]|uniref:Diguanylate cyclase n=1 Tax=Aliarcobacter trophiarum LMG 25534 TaxID=1032241 RepID=A0AAD0QID3_9BACT|nr:diguanylate cyclase [Aliarcobacter trophiarum]AXK48329.1 multi-sensor domain-containing diguanylate cyclase [Aliarcobacter trophiarum LMG 25534]RXJ92995.1 diguanylate cyclase [Aliarcobacter trophiarum LMG 25534]